MRVRPAIRFPFRRVLRAGSAVLTAAGRPAASAQPQPEPRHAPPPFTAVADTLVPAALREFGVPGAAVAVVARGAVVGARGYGVADRASGRPVTPRTVFNVGSVSKSVTAWGVLALVGTGRLALDAPVDATLTRWHLPPSPHDRAGVTPRRLLSHTAGLSLPSVTPFAAGAATPALERLLEGGPGLGDGVRLVRPPGAQFQYSGGGYDVLQLLVEEASGRPFAAYMDSAVFRPLGMRHTAFAWPPALAAAAATPYDRLGRPAPAERFVEAAAAGLQTTAADLATLAATALAGPADARPGRGVLTPALVRLMHTPAPPAREWGLGHEVLRDSATGRVFAGHNGANTGWQALVRVAPESGDGVVVLTNSANGFAVVQRVACAWERAVAPGARTRYCEPPGVRAALYAPYAAGGVAGLVARHEALRGGARAARDRRYTFDPSQLNGLGYDLLRAGLGADAVAVFEANARAYPGEWNVHDSLGEAYLARGDTARARAAYRRSVALHPGNDHGAAVLRRLDGPGAGPP